MSISINVANINLRPSFATPTLLKKTSARRHLPSLTLSKQHLKWHYQVDRPQFRGLPNEDAQAVGQLFSGIEPDALGQIESRTPTVIAETRASIRSGDASGLSTLSSGKQKAAKPGLNPSHLLQRMAEKNKASSPAG